MKNKKIVEKDYRANVQRIIFLISLFFLVYSKIFLEAVIVQPIFSNKTECSFKINETRGLAIKVNQTLRIPGRCQVCECVKDGDLLSYSCKGCQKVAINKVGCKIFQNITLKYPECCEKLIC